MILDATAAHDLILDMDRAAFDALVTMRAHTLVEAHPRRATYPTQADREAADQAYEDATALVSITAEFADQVDRLPADNRDRHGQPDGYARSVYVVGDTPIVVADVRWDLYRAEVTAEAGGHLDLVILGGPLVQYLLTGQATTWRA